MVKLRSFCFKGTDLDNTASAMTCFLPQNGDKQSWSAASYRFAKPLFGMRSTGFGVGFRFLAALLQGFVVHIFNYEFVAVCQQFVGENIMLRLAYGSKLAVQIPQPCTAADNSFCYSSNDEFAYVRSCVSAV